MVSLFPPPLCLWSHVALSASNRLPPTPQGQDRSATLGAQPQLAAWRGAGLVSIY